MLFFSHVLHVVSSVTLVGVVLSSVPRGSGHFQLSARSGSPALLVLRLPLFRGMASESEMKQLLSDKGESELLFMLGEKEVEIGDQFKLAQARVTKLSRFASIEDDRDNL